MLLGAWGWWVRGGRLVLIRVLCFYLSYRYFFGMLLLLLLLG